jgi:hypothetical protein
MPDRTPTTAYPLHAKGSDEEVSFSFLRKGQG